VIVNEAIEYSLVSMTGTSGRFLVATALIPSLEKKLNKEVQRLQTISGFVVVFFSFSFLFSSLPLTQH
jgi:intracellular septation protein A